MCATSPLFLLLFLDQREQQKKKRKAKKKMSDTELCFVVEANYFLNFCAQLTKQGCDVVAVNTYHAKPLVWVTNCPILKNFLVPISQTDFLCSGFEVRVLEGKRKGKTCKRIKNVSYFDLIQICERSRPTSWSPPSCLDNVKKLFF